MTITLRQIDEIVNECGVPMHVKTEDGEAWYWRFEGNDLWAADSLSELFLIALQMGIA